MSYLLIVTAVYVGSVAPGEANIRIETRNLSARDCNTAKTKWGRTLSYLGARNIEIKCKPEGR